MSEVERLAKVLYVQYHAAFGITYVFEWDDVSEYHKKCYRKFAQAILDVGYVHRDRVGLDVKIVAQELFEFEVSDSDLAEMGEKEIAYLLRYCEKRAKFLAAAKDEIIKVAEPKKEE